MVDLDKLWKKLEDALAKETPESMRLFLEEHRGKDYYESAILTFNEPCFISLTSNSIIEEKHVSPHNLDITYSCPCSFNPFETHVSSDVNSAA